MAAMALLGAGLWGGAIYNLGLLTILNCSFLTNSAVGGTGGDGGGGSDGTWLGGNGGKGGVGALGFGGAIYNLGTLWLKDSTFSGNTAIGGNGGNGGTNGAGPWDGNTVRCRRCRRSRFRRGRVQRAESDRHQLHFQPQRRARWHQCRRRQRLVHRQRGEWSEWSQRFWRRDSTFEAWERSPTALSSAMGCSAATGANGGNAMLSSGLSSGNGGNGGNGMGGGLYNTGAVVVVNCTFSSCGALGGTNGLGGTAIFPGRDGTPGAGRGAGIAQQGSGAFVLRNSILAASLAGTNAYATSGSPITDGGFNISSDASLNFSGTSLKNTDPKLGSLASNGGPTPTIAVQTNSPALDRIPPNLSPPTDQRGVLRPQGAACDVGAFELTVPPAIVVEPHSQTNAIGTSVTFTVSANGEPLGYQWRFNSAALTNATAASYTIPSVAPTNAGAYDVIVTNNSGSVTSAVATLAVLVPPAITTQPSNQIAAIGGSVSFSVTATGFAPLKYQWTFQGTNLAGTTGNTLQVTNVQSSQAGSYAVTITNLAGSVTSATATLTIVTSPFIISIQPTSQSVPAGGAAAFTVNAVGAAPLAYQWLFKGTPVANATGSSYTLAHAQSTNGGPYTVVVTNGSGTITSAPVTLVVYPLPHIAVQPDGSVQLVFAPALICQVQAATNLGNWQAVLTTNNLPADMPLLGFTDTNAASNPMRFYRVRQILAGQPALTNFFAADQSVALDCVAAPVLACQIEASTNLTSWSPIFTNTFSNAVSFQFRYAEATNSSMRFYRLSQTTGF